MEPGGAIIAVEIRRERVDCEGEVLESFASKIRDKAALLKLISKALKRHGRPKVGGLRRMEAARRLTMSPLPQSRLVETSWRWTDTTSGF